jgi:pilus assembly protein Flp/PilA
MLQLSMTLAWIRTRFAVLQAREEGITAVEYALMVAVVALLLVVGFFFLFTNIKTKFSNTGSCVGNGPTGAGC